MDTPPMSLIPHREHTQVCRGFRLNFKIMYRRDGCAMVFAVDINDSAKTTARLEAIVPHFTTWVDHGVYMWRQLPEVAEDLMEQIRGIDCEG